MNTTYDVIGGGYKFVYSPGDGKPPFTAELTDTQVADRLGPDAVAKYIDDNQQDMFQDSVQYLANSAPIKDPAGSGFTVDPNTGMVREYQETFNTVPESDKIKSQVLGQGYIKDIPALQELKSQTNPANIEGYSYQGNIRKVDGPAINPYAGINPNKNVTEELYETIGGADLALFLIMEVPVMEDLSLPVEIQRKEMVTMELDNALSMSYSTLREIFPVRSLGHINPKAFVRGIRTISGHIAFGIFTKDVLQHLRSRVAQEISIIDKNFNKFDASNATEEQILDYSERYSKWLDEKRAYSSLGQKAQLLDDLPPFHLLCMGTNENGVFSKFIIKNVAIIDENQLQGTTQPNIINRVSWVAMDIIPMNEVEKWQQKTTLVSSVDSIESSYIGGNYNGKINYNFEITGSTLLDSVLDDLGA